MFLYFIGTFIFYFMKKYKIIKENDNFVPYGKKLFGWERLVSGSFPTIYIAIKFLSDNYGTPTIFSGNTNLNIEF